MKCPLDSFNFVGPDRGHDVLWISGDGSKVMAMKDTLEGFEDTIRYTCFLLPIFKAGHGHVPQGIVLRRTNSFKGEFHYVGPFMEDLSSRPGYEQVTREIDHQGRAIASAE